MSPRRHRIALLAYVCALVAAAPAAAGRVAVVVEPPFPLDRYAADGAVGLLVPGAGSTVTRAGALASLVRGRVESSLVGGTPGGAASIRLARVPGPVTVHVSLPPPGPTHNVVRYPIAIVGGGYRGLLRSSSTRIPGLVSIADVAPTARALEAGKAPRITSRPDPAAAADARRLDARLAAAHAVRVPARLTFTGLILAFFAAGFLLRSRTAARAAVLVSPLVLVACLALSAAHVYREEWVVASLVAAGVAAAVLARLGDVPTAVVAVACLAAELLVLAAWPTVNALSAIGPHPDGGGRYYGVTNELEAMLLAPALYAAAVLPAALPALAVLGLVLVGWSGAGADGGGLLVFAVAFAVLWLRRRGGRIGARGLLLALAAAVAVGAVVVGIDAATGGSSHVTRAVGGGPGSLLGDLAHRQHVGWAGATSSWSIVVQTFAPLLAFAVFFLARPRHAVVDAMLVAVAVSLVVNDTPQDVISVGAMCCGALWAWGRLDQAPRPWAREVVMITPHPRPAGRTG